MIRTVLLLATLSLSASAAVAAGTSAPLKVGAVTWHTARYAGKKITLRGYLLRREAGYLIFSDEAGGSLSAHDLPVTGTGLDSVEPRRAYTLSGRLVKGGLAAVNGNPYHLELSAPPVPTPAKGG